MLLIWCNSCVKLSRKKKRSTKTFYKPFINKYNWKRINFSSEKDDLRRIEKNNVTIMYYCSKRFIYAKKEKYILLMFQKLTQTVKISYSFNDFRS